VTLWAELARAGNAAGDEIILRRRDDIFEIRYNGLELMSNRNHASEDILATRSIELRATRANKVLIGGLGMGFTLRTTLNQLGADAEVVVCELVPEIVAWNQTSLAHLADHPLRDPRVRVRMGDVMEVIRQEAGAYDLILMDTDNGPDFTVRAFNEVIYESAGLQAVRRALRRGGIASFWSATLSPTFERALDGVFPDWWRDKVPLIAGRSDAIHYIYFASDGPQPSMTTVPARSDDTFVVPDSNW
jgi:spermidine synthase